MIILIVVIALALMFDVINGFHDAANSIATIVSTKVLTPFQAVIWAAFFNFIAYLIFGLHVANTVGKGIVHTEVVTLPVLIAGLLASIIWNLLTWWCGIPSSSSHTLLGGFVGAALAHAGALSSHGVNVINYANVIPSFLFIVLAPLIGSIVAFLITILIVNLFQKSNPYRA